MIQPKASGLLNLLELVAERGWELDWLVAFSSTSSLGGYAGQANYAAANALLDAFAAFHHLQSHTTPPLLVMNWGPWGEAGMAAEGTKAHALSIANGEMPLSTADGLCCLATALARSIRSNFGHGRTASSGTQFAGCDCQWDKTPWAGAPLLSYVERAVEIDGFSHTDDDDDDNDGEDDGDSAGNTDDGARSTDSVVVGFLRDRIPRWELGATLLQLGMDSLDAVSMRNQFNKVFKPKTGPLPMETFASPNRQLSELIQTLEAAVAP
eukprot:SAG31_NODE_1358_length_8643_cov_11.893375_3_plen_267_part_00